MWSSDEMGYIHELVFNRELSATQGRILELMNESSETKMKDWKGKISRISADEMAIKMKMPVNNVRHHIRVMESKNILRQVYIFEDGFVVGFKKALKKGLRACSGNFYSLDILNKFNGERAKK